ncbi:MAG: radical SAM protein [Candidatus Heimdallarchaeota archaeon]
MWRLLRPNSTQVWQDTVVRERFARYYNIIVNKRIARYLIAKQVDIGVKSLTNQEISALWKIHDKKSKDFKQLLQTIDEGKKPFSGLKTPKISYLDLKVELAKRMITNCEFCEHRCEINRMAGETGRCRLTSDSYVSSVFLHHGEESPLVPSGTIFFCGCNFRCVFCQNWSISQGWIKEKVVDGSLTTPKQLAAYAKHLAREGARNINWVGGSPTPNTHNILEALRLMDENICILWNSNMYMTEKTTNLLLDVMDFWLPDLKYFDDVFAKKMSGIENYRAVVTRNIKAAYDNGSGEIIIRHLVMPGRINKDTLPILEWCANNVPNALVNIMGQYRPEYKARYDPRYKEIRQRPSTEEMKQAFRIANQLGIVWEPVS